MTTNICFNHDEHNTKKKDLSTQVLLKDALKVVSHQILVTYHIQTPEEVTRYPVVNKTNLVLTA